MKRGTNNKDNPIKFFLSVLYKKSFLFGFNGIGQIKNLSSSYPLTYLFLNPYINGIVKYCECQEYNHISLTIYCLHA